MSFIKRYLRSSRLLARNWTCLGYAKTTYVRLHTSLERVPRVVAKGVGATSPPSLATPLQHQHIHRCCRIEHRNHVFPREAPLSAHFCVGDSTAKRPWSEFSDIRQQPSASRSRGAVTVRSFSGVATWIASDSSQCKIPDHFDTIPALLPLLACKPLQFGASEWRRRE